MTACISLLLLAGICFLGVLLFGNAYHQRGMTSSFIWSITGVRMGGIVGVGLIALFLCACSFGMFTGAYLGWIMWHRGQRQKPATATISKARSTDRGTTDKTEVNGMKALWRRSWWQVSLYSICGGYLWFWLMVGGIGWLAVNKHSYDDYVIKEPLLVLLSWGLFAGFILFGGLRFFRKMTRKELLCSATVMFAFSTITQTMASHMGYGAVFEILVKLGAWYHVIPKALTALGINPQVGAIISWAAVYLFVPFGRKSDNT